ncbi:MAG: hypothetical protein WCO26_25845, partial [Deltaproteobacteria bacterium]
MFELPGKTREEWLPPRTLLSSFWSPHKINLFIPYSFFENKRLRLNPAMKSQGVVGSGVSGQGV